MTNSTSVNKRVEAIMGENIENNFYALACFCDSRESQEVYEAIRARITQDVIAHSQGKPIPTGRRPLLSNKGRTLVYEDGTNRHLEPGEHPNTLYSIQHISPIDPLANEPIDLMQYKFVLPRSVSKEFLEQCELYGFGQARNSNNYGGGCPLKTIVRECSDKMNVRGDQAHHLSVVSGQDRDGDGTLLTIGSNGNEQNIFPLVMVKEGQASSHRTRLLKERTRNLGNDDGIYAS